MFRFVLKQLRLLGVACLLLLAALLPMSAVFTHSTFAQAGPSPAVYRYHVTIQGSIAGQMFSPQQATLLIAIPGQPAVVFLKIIMVIPRLAFAVPDLHESNSALQQAASDQ